MHTCIRWMIRKDMGDVLSIERQSFPFPWTEDEFITCLRQRNCIGMVAERDKAIVGYMIYELHKTRLHILNFCVHPKWRRQGVGRVMVEKLVSKLSYQRRTRIMFEVSEVNLPAQLFFRAMGFKAINVLRNFYAETGQDAYVMQLRYIATDAELEVKYT